MTLGRNGESFRFAVVTMPAQGDAVGGVNEGVVLVAVAPFLARLFVLPVLALFGLLPLGPGRVLGGPGSLWVTEDLSVGVAVGPDGGGVHGDETAQGR